jgi:hypothetical protein
MGESKKRASSDVALLYAPTDDGKGARVLRARDGLLEAGEVRPVKEGQPINQGEVVKLTPIQAGAPCLCNVEVLHAGDATRQAPSAPPSANLAESARSAEANGGPAQVATEDYRLNWDRIFGRRVKQGRSLN